MGLWISSLLLGLSFNALPKHTFTITFYNPSCICLYDYHRISRGFASYFNCLSKHFKAEAGVKRNGVSGS
jgi:hypothetical protein